MQSGQRLTDYLSTVDTDEVTDLRARSLAGDRAHALLGLGEVQLEMRQLRDELKRPLLKAAATMISMKAISRITTS